MDTCNLKELGLVCKLCLSQVILLCKLPWPFLLESMYHAGQLNLNVSYRSKCNSIGIAGLFAKQQCYVMYDTN